MIKISVILPVYNREEFLPRVLVSLEKQTFRDFELIIVDDGSVDFSYEIARKFCSENENWKVFKCSHLGVSNARIYGLRVSLGKYVSFVDSDDYVEPNFLEVLYQNIKDSQISICNYDISFGKFQIRFANLLFHRSGDFLRDQILKSLVLDISLKSFLWNKLFEKKLFENVVIPEICFEDKIICLQLFSKIKKCTITKKVLYHYNKNVSSMTWKMNEKSLNDYMEFSEFLKDFFVSKNEYSKFKVIHKIFSIHVFAIVFKVLFYEHIFKKFDVKLFFKKIFLYFKRIIFSLKILKKE